MQRPATGGIGTDLSHRMTTPAHLTPREAEVAELARAYVYIAQEPPSSGWLSRRLNISRKNAHKHVEALRGKGCWPPR